MTTENRLGNDPFTFTLTADSPFGFGNIFGSFDGVKLNETKVVMYEAPITTVTEPYPGDLKITGESCYITASGSGLTSNYIDPVQGMIARIEKLEQQMEMWQSAAVTLAEINRKLQDAAESDRNDHLTFGEEYPAIFTEEDMKPKTRSIGHSPVKIDVDHHDAANPMFSFNLASGEVIFANPPATTYTIAPDEQYDPSAMMGNYYFGGSPLTISEPAAPQETAEQAYARAMKAVR